MPTRAPRSTTPEYGPCRFCGASFLIYTPGQRGRIADFCGDDCRKLSAALDVLDDGTAFLNGRPNAKAIRTRLLAAVNGIHAGVVQAQAERKQKKEQAAQALAAEQAKREEEASAERARVALRAQLEEAKRQERAAAQEAEQTRAALKEAAELLAHVESVKKAGAEASPVWVEMLSSSGVWLVVFGKQTVEQARLMVAAAPFRASLRVVDSQTRAVIPLN